MDIIDTHTHMTDGKFRAGDSPGLTFTETLKAMDDNGIFRIWCSPSSGLYANGEYGECNRAMYKFFKGEQARIKGFFTVNPNYGIKTLDEIKRCVEDYGFAGLKLHPWLQAFPVTTNLIDKITEICTKYDIPIIFHDGTPPYASTLQIANLAERHPNAKIILGHSGLLEMYDDAISAAKRLNNIYLSITGPSISHIQAIVKNVSIEKLFFGSDFGFTRSTAALVYRLDMWNYINIDEDSKKKIFYDNAMRIIP